ncbi:YybH family protein [Actinomarinicola tropica]|uniref:SgcJ/EcaC family oxidoreductase n=1 Tax=Actinomarinicola tropica TaxID=2789776 RepID=A0A5Q2RFN2_9ACTN|nr:SgcJ/EcaC family oxidoreductase [Actinomarinicola tropica]QGG95639.1 SgcJ/EcaC family oxidoreductase [Actinomarinicola tropica]
MDAHSEAEARDEIGRLVDQLNEQQFDVEEFLALHTDDVIIVNFGGRRVTGKDALREAMSAALGSSLAKVTTTVEVHDVHFVRPDVALVNATKYVSDERDGDEAFASTGSSTYVVTRDERSGWRVALAQTTPVAGA